MSQFSCLHLSLTKHPKPELNISHCASVMTGPVKLTSTLYLPKPPASVLATSLLGAVTKAME